MESSQQGKTVDPASMATLCLTEVVLRDLQTGHGRPSRHGDARSHCPMPGRDLLTSESGPAPAMLRVHAHGELCSETLMAHHMPHGTLDNSLQHTDSGTSMNRPQATAQLVQQATTDKPAGAAESTRVTRSCTLNRINSSSDLHAGPPGPTSRTPGRRFMLLMQRMFACMGPEPGLPYTMPHNPAATSERVAKGAPLKRQAGAAQHMIDGARDASMGLQASGLSQLTDASHVWPSVSTSNHLSDSRFWRPGSLVETLDSRPHSGTHGNTLESINLTTEAGYISCGPPSAGSVPARPGLSSSQAPHLGTSQEDLAQLQNHPEVPAAVPAGAHPIATAMVGPHAASSYAAGAAEPGIMQGEQPSAGGDILLVPLYNSPMIATAPSIGPSLRAPTRLSRQLRQQVILPAPAHTVAQVLLQDNSSASSRSNSFNSLAPRQQQQDPVLQVRPMGPHERSSAGCRGSSNRVMPVGFGDRPRRASGQPAPTLVTLREPLARLQAAVSLSKERVTLLLPAIMAGNSGSQEEAWAVSRELAFARAPRFSSSRGRMQTAGRNSAGGPSSTQCSHGALPLPRGSGLRTCTSANSLHTMAGGQSSPTPHGIPQALHSGKIFMLKLGLVGTRGSAGGAGGGGASTESSITGAGTDKPNIAVGGDDRSSLSLSSKLHLGGGGEFPIVMNLMDVGSLDSPRVQRSGSYTAAKVPAPAPPRAQIVYCHPLMAQMCLQRRSSAARSAVPVIPVPTAQLPRLFSRTRPLPKSASLPYIANGESDSPHVPTSPFSLMARANSCARFTPGQGYPQSPCFLVLEGQPQPHSPPDSPAIPHTSTGPIQPLPLKISTECPHESESAPSLRAIAPSSLLNPCAMPRRAAHSTSSHSARTVAHTVTAPAGTHHTPDPGCALTASGDGEPMLSLADFQPLHVLHTGYAADVHQAFCVVMGRMCVMKTYHLERLDATGRRHMRREVAILAGAAGVPGVVRLWAAFQEDEHMVLVLDFCDAGDLQGILARHGGRLGEHHAVRKVLHPLLTVLQALHGSGVVHRDIKLSNICFTRQGELRLCDLGLAIDTRQERPRSRVGTPGYMAPELLDPFHSDGDSDEQPASDAAPSVHQTGALVRGSLANSCTTPSHLEGTRGGAVPLTRGQYTPASVSEENCHQMGACAVTAPPSEAALDIWSVGVTACVMITGRKPYTEETLSAVLESGSPLPPLDLTAHHLPLDAQHFLRVTLEQDPADRPTSAELLNHPWLVRVMGQQRNLNSTHSRNPHGI